MKNSQKGFAIPIIIAIVALLTLSGGGYYYAKKIGVIPDDRPGDILPPEATTTPEKIISGGRDANGCIGSAGYSWCAVKNKCLRTWEEKCEVTTTTTKPAPVACTMDAMQCPDGSYVGRTGSNCEFVCPVNSIDNALMFINELKKVLSFNQQEILKTNRNLSFSYGANCSGTENLSGYLIKSINPNLTSYGFINTSYNTGDAMFSSSQGMRKDSVVCQLRNTYVPENGDSKICFTDQNSDEPNLLVCPRRTEFFCADLNQISKNKFKENCENRG